MFATAPPGPGTSHRLLSLSPSLLLCYGSLDGSVSLLKVSSPSNVEVTQRFIAREEAVTACAATTVETVEDGKEEKAVVLAMGMADGTTELIVLSLPTSSSSLPTVQSSVPGPRFSTCLRTLTLQAQSPTLLLLAMSDESVDSPLRVCELQLSWQSGQPSLSASSSDDDDFAALPSDDFGTQDNGNDKAGKEEAALRAVVAIRKTYALADTLDFPKECRNEWMRSLQFHPSADPSASSCLTLSAVSSSHRLAFFTLGPDASLDNSFLHLDAIPLSNDPSDPGRNCSNTPRQQSYSPAAVSALAGQHDAALAYPGESVPRYRDLQHLKKPQYLEAGRDGTPSGGGADKAAAAAAGTINVLASAMGGGGKASLLASSSGMPGHAVRLWSFGAAAGRGDAGGKQRLVPTLKGEAGEAAKRKAGVTGLAFAMDGEAVIAACEDGTAYALPVTWESEDVNDGKLSEKTAAEKNKGENDSKSTAGRLVKSAAKSAAADDDDDDDVFGADAAMTHARKPDAKKALEEDDDDDDVPAMASIGDDGGILEGNGGDADADKRGGDGDKMDEEKLPDMMDQEDDTMLPPDDFGDGIGKEVAMSNGDMNKLCVDTVKRELKASLKKQAAFMSGSTPLPDDLDAERNWILSWNHVGVATVKDKAGVEYVELEFTSAVAADGLPLPAVNFPNLERFMVGAMGDDGAVFASFGADDDEVMDEEDADVANLGLGATAEFIMKKKKNAKKKGGFTGSVVHYHKYATFGPQATKDWTATLPAGEIATCVASGSGWAAVGTSRDWLRFYTAGGMPMSVVALPGALVTITGRKALLAAFYHEASPCPDGSQHLAYVVYDMEGQVELCTGRVALSKGSELTWAGITDEGMVAIMDSHGLVAVLAKTIGWSWTPILDTASLRRTVDDSHWPVCVHRGSLVCVPLKAPFKCPNPLRRPVVDNVPFRVPVSRQGPTLDLLEDEYLRKRMVVSHRETLASVQMTFSDADPAKAQEEYEGMLRHVDALTLRLYVNALKTRHLEKAFDLIVNLRLDASFSHALTLCDQAQNIVNSVRQNFIAKITQVRDLRFPPVETEYGNYYEEEENYPDHNSAAVMTHASEQEHFETITPESLRKQKLQQRAEEQRADDLSSPGQQPRGSKRPAEAAPEPTPADSRGGSTAPVNPFAKKKMTIAPSPNKKSSISGLLTSPSPGKSTPALSRSSTFSAKGRDNNKSAKRII